MENLKKAILSTLAYADVFDYPLTPEELYRFLIADKSLSFASFKEVFTRITTNEKLIDTNRKYFFLRNRKMLVALRKKRARWSREKIKIGNHVASWLRLIPWIKMVGVTGALALLNSDRDDDIDILIVSGKNRLWLTRLLAAFLVELLGQRRRPGDKEVKDKICLNMFLDEDHLAVPEKEQDLFSAHEVCQMRPLWEKKNTYQKFLAANQWVKKYLPNVLDSKIKIEKRKMTYKKEKRFLLNFSFWEKLLQQSQLWYMRNRRTTEVISEGIIRFHPQDAREWVLRQYQSRLEKLGISG